MSAEMTVEGMISVFMKIRKVYADEVGRLVEMRHILRMKYQFLLFFGK